MFCACNQTCSLARSLSCTQPVHSVVVAAFAAAAVIIFLTFFFFDLSMFVCSFFLWIISIIVFGAVDTHLQHNPLTKIGKGKRVRAFEPNSVRVCYVLGRVSVSVCVCELTGIFHLRLININNPYRCYFSRNASFSSAFVPQILCF